MSYKTKSNFEINVGFELKTKNILNAVNGTNNFLKTLPESLFKSIDYKTAGALIGAVFCEQIAKNTDGASVNPIEKGHPDIIPTTGLKASEEKLRNYKEGLEVKGTIGNIKKGANLRAGQRRINELTGITWQAHHREVKQLMGFVWDFNSNHNKFHFPMIIGVFYSDNLGESDWGEISGTTGRNTKVTGMLKSGKEKMGNGWIVMIDEKVYKDKFKSYLNIDIS
jgi:hypothetical protein